MSSMKFVYCITSKNKEYLKIGMSGNPIERMDRIQTGCPLDLELYHFVLADPNIGSQTENKVKKELKRMGLWNKREWYKFRDIEKIVKTMNYYEYKKIKRFSKSKRKAIKNLEKEIGKMDQNTQEWLDYRMNGIGASDAPAIMGRSLHKTKNKLWNEKFHKIAETEEERKAMEFICNKGHRLEAWARPGIEFQTGTTWRPSLFEHKTFPFIRASLDGWAPGLNEFWECKFMGADLYEILSDESKPALERIPPQYYDQIMQQFFATGATQGRLTGIIEFVTNKKIRIDQKERGLEQEKKEIELRQYTLLIPRTEEVENYINKTLAPALFAFWDSVLKGIEPPLDNRDVSKTDNKEFTELVKTYGQLVAQKKELETEAKKAAQEILGDIPGQVEKTKSLIENHGARNHNKMDVEGFKLTEKRGRETIDYKAAFEAFIEWVKSLKVAPRSELNEAIDSFPDEPNMEKYTKVGKPSFAITIPKPKKEEAEKDVRETHKEMNGKVFDGAQGSSGPDEIPRPKTEIVDLVSPEITNWKNPINGKSPRGWKGQTNEWRLKYCRQQKRKASPGHAGLMEDFDKIINLLEPKKEETINGVTFS